jgi:hypothetical protein
MARHLRREWAGSKKEEMTRLIRSELKILERALPYIESDSRQGYHSEAGAYLFGAESVRAKIKTLKNRI